MLEWEPRSCDLRVTRRSTIDDAGDDDEADVKEGGRKKYSLKFSLFIATKKQ